MTSPGANTTDPWLDRWLDLVAERAGAAPVLELGCGTGRDSAVLVNAGQRVVGIELSTESVAAARARVPHGAEFHRTDFRAPFPVADGSVGVVLASLSLHYFAWDETLALARRMHCVLRPGGVLLCRLNSVNDFHHGASGPPPKGEDSFYLVDGVPKRFFDREAVERLFAEGWRMLRLEELTVERYEQPKVLWEAVLERK
ncbi:class I SAM-dependent methyltransferase [Variovorax sp. CCNWLW235]|uniref:class I SAM-dependent methyltransferase n=1 Tax=Variovorax sp. CCNWLW235 TaxID=3127463 RepID=UPI003076F9DB